MSSIRFFSKVFLTALLGIFSFIHLALADQSACMPLKYEQAGGEGGGPVVFNAVPLFPGVVPPKPKPTFPLNPLVVEGNDGQFVQIGSNVTHLEFARFQWRAGAFAASPAAGFRFPFGPVFQLGLTTHYEICLFQDNFENRCEDKIAASGDNNGKGFLKMYESCSAEIHLVNGMRGVSPASGGPSSFRPQFDPSIGSQVLEVFWKMRACNLDKCSDWTNKISLFWVPPPVLRAPTFTKTQNSTLLNPTMATTDFPVTFTWVPAAGIRTGARYVPPSARLCIASPGQRCPSGGTPNPPGPGAFEDPWVMWVDVPNTPGVGITGTVNYFDSNNHIFGFAGQTVNWSAANCWELPAGNVVCVYNNNVGTVAFLP